jgi:hypothetical protein
MIFSMTKMPIVPRTRRIRVLDLRTMEAVPKCQILEQPQVADSKNLLFAIWG